MKLRLLYILFIGLALGSCRMKEGCTDPAATNYDVEAEKDCQCCTYDNTPKRFEGKLDLTFNTKYFIAPYTVGDTVVDPNNGNLIFNNLIFYLSNISLIDQFNNEKKLRDVELFEFANGANSVTVSFDSIASGSYTGIKFGLGVDSIFNNQSPSNFPFGHPLSNVAYNWGPKNYVFTRTEGRADTASTGNYNLLLAYHTGTDSLYRKLEFNAIPIIISTNETTNYSLNLNLDKLFYGANDTIDYKIDSQTHTNPGDPLAKRVTDNFVGLISE